MADEHDPRRLELVVLDLINYGTARCGSGFGKFPLGIKEAVDRLLPLCNRDDPAFPAIERGLAAFNERLSR